MAASTGTPDGFYIGGSLDGVGLWANYKSGAAKTDLGAYGIGGSGFGGYGMTFGSGVYGGLEASYGLSSSQAGVTTSPSVTGKLSDPNSLAAVGRLGYELTRDLLMFLDGGLAYDQYTWKNSPGLSSSKWDTGLRIGAGMEYTFGGGWFSRIDYQMDFNRFTPTSGASLNPVIGRTRLGVGYRF